MECCLNLVCEWEIDEIQKDDISVLYTRSVLYLTI